MNYLDAAIAFAVLMAVLAGLVTTLMQGAWRLLRVKQGNLIKVLKKLDDTVLQSSSLNLSPEQRWNTIASILNNPTSGSPSLPTAEELEKDKKLPRRLRPRMATLSSADGGKSVAETAIEELDRIHANGGQFEKVTAEHVARRLTEEVARSNAKVSHERLAEQLNLTVRKFEEFSSAMSTEFTRRSYYWSIGVGIFLALAFNINGLVAFNVFLAEPDLADQIALSANAVSDQTNTPENAGQLLRELDATLRDLSDKGVPVGPEFWPHCLKTNPDNCDPPTGFDSDGWGIFLFLWFPSAVVTGIFIGLGAPFWFDVAKRLSAVRSMFGGADKAAERLSGRSADGNPETRAKIVASVVNDQLGGEPMLKRHTFDNIVDQSKFTVTVKDNSANTHFHLTLLGGDGSSTEFLNNDIRQGIAHTLDASAGFYRTDLEVIFRGNDIATVEIDIPGNSAEPLKFQLTGEKGQVCRVICAIFMA